MRIGEFAKACNVPISVLRYYDTLGLLKPVYTDGFTGYRYYAESQIDVWNRINELKTAGFSLAEIKQLIFGSLEVEKINAIFDDKKKQLNEMLLHIDELHNSILGGNFMETVKIERLHENVHIPFENDEKVIGKWEILGEYNSRTEFDLDQPLAEVSVGSKKREIYFLPEGEWYWCYAWTKGKVLIEGGDSSTVNEYVMEKQPDGLYMFVNLKSYDYLQSGRTNVLALRQVDNKHYTSDEIARKDNIDIPFVNDDAVLGKWKAVGVVQHIEEFFCQNTIEGVELYFKEIEFFQNGECTSVYGDEVIHGRNMQEWTKGYVLRKWNSTACAYEIKMIDKTEYLFIEWKSGDYRWGGFDSDYYIFKRA